MTHSAETRRCQYHCSGCDSCFLSLRAFDAHRFGPWESRTCWDESVEEKVEIAREDGLCEIGFDQPTLGRTLWRAPHGKSDASSADPGSNPDLAA